MKTETGMIEEKIGRGKKEERNDVEWTKKKKPVAGAVGRVTHAPETRPRIEMR